MAEPAQPAQPAQHQREAAEATEAGPDSFIVDHTSVAYARQVLIDSKIALTPSNLFCIVWVCTQTLLARGVPLDLIKSLLADASAQLPKLPTPPKESTSSDAEDPAARP